MPQLLSPRNTLRLMTTAVRSRPEFASRVHVVLAPGTHGVEVASVYGTSEQLRDIAQQLNNALDSLPHEAVEFDSPRSLFSVPATGLSAVNTPAVLAFYVAPAAAPKPKPWRGRAFGSIWALGLAIVGVVALVKWFMGLFL